MEKKNDTARKWAAQALGKIGDSGAIAPLVQALKDEHQNVRHFVMEALSDIGEPAIAPLTRALNDKHEDFRRLVKEVLENIRVKTDIQTLILKC